jgi:hypothetical protein
VREAVNDFVFHGDLLGCGGVRFDEQTLPLALTKSNSYLYKLKGYTEGHKSRYSRY